MAPSRRYKVLVNGEVVFSGSFRTSEVVYDAIVLAFEQFPSSVAVSIPVVDLAFDFK